LIESQSELATRLSVRQLQGKLSGKLVHLEERLTWCLAHMQAAIDFSTEDIEYIQHDELKQEIRLVLDEAGELLSTFNPGSLVRNGLKIAILGPPNAGKSSLLNALLDEDRAIVTEIPGTTRDVIEGHLMLGGVPVVLLDTAGIRETDDQIERLGIQRTLGASKSADMILYVFDALVGINSLDIQFLADQNQVSGTTPIIFVGNKADLDPSGVKIAAAEAVIGEFERFSRRSGRAQVLVSARSKFGVQKLRDLFLEYQREQGVLDLSVSINSRHFEGLTRVSVNLEKALSGIHENISPEFITFDLQEALSSVLRILGKSYDDQVLDRVFKEFCLGK
jgi:tRNA modification GTPase